MIEDDGRAAPAPTSSRAGTPAAAPPATRIFLRPIGSPLPLGLVGLAVATAVLSCFNLSWIPTAEQHQVALVLLAFAFPLQLVSSVLLFLARDAPSGAGMGVLSVTWLSLGLLLVTGKPGALSATVSIFLFAAAAALLPSVATSALGKLVPAAVMATASLRFVLTGLYERFGSTSWEHAAGWAGVFLAGLALYAAFASDLESQLHRTILPMGRHSAGRRALQEKLLDQASELQSEPGVRPQI